ncbi:hypothetical protein [Promicromonospora soli]
MLPKQRSSVALALVAAVLALAACTYDRSAPIRGELAPTPEPTGALFSRVMHADGYSAPRSSVSVYLYDTANDVKAVTATLSLGFFCLLPGPFCPRPVSADVDAQGLWSLKEDELGDAAAGLQATATLHVDDAEFGPNTTLVLPESDADGGPRRIPDLVYWEPELTVTGKDGLLEVSWPAATGVPAGKKVTYTVVSASTGDTASEPLLLAGPTTDTAARVDARVYADAPSELMVVAQTTMKIGGERVEAAYRSAGVSPPGDLTPPSRGAECLAEDEASGELKPAASPCPITDGDVERDGDGVRLPGACAVETPAVETDATGSASDGPDGAKECVEPNHPRVCVVLPEPRDVSLVVVRTPFNPLGQEVELLDADRRVLTSRAVEGDAFDEVYPVAFEQPVRTGLVCVKDKAGAGGLLGEVSVW